MTPATDNTPQPATDNTPRPATGNPTPEKAAAT